MDTSIILERIVNNCKEFCKYSNDVSCNLAGDSLEVLKKIPSGSISLVSLQSNDKMG